MLTLTYNSPFLLTEIPHLVAYRIINFEMKLLGRLLDQEKVHDEVGGAGANKCAERSGMVNICHFLAFM